MKAFLLGVATAALLLVQAACGSQASSTTAPASTLSPATPSTVLEATAQTPEPGPGGEAVQTDVPPPTSPGSKALPPLEVGLAVEEEELFVGGEFHLSLRFTPRENLGRATGQVEASGVVVLTEGLDLEWNDLPGGQEVITRTGFRISGAGEGEIRWVVQAADESGANAYWRRADLFFLAEGEDVITGTDGPLALKLEQLKRALESGTISQQDYDEARERILGGGAIESNEPVPTAP